MNDKNTSKENQSDGTVQCPDCGSNQVSTSYKTEVMKVLVKEKETEVSVSVPVRKCEACQTEFTDEEANEIRHNAACHARGLLTPSEIKAIRNNLNLSRSEFAELTGIGEASVARWERGELIQNESNDSLIYLASFSDNVERLRKRGARVSLTDIGTLRIQTDYRYLMVEVTPDLKTRASMFSLTRRGVATCTP